MPKHSAGILVYRQTGNKIEVLLVHPGGPFWAKKDNGAWSIPKGEFDTEEGLKAAKREFQEETGHTPPAGNYLELGTVKNKSGKIIHVWAVEGDFDTSNIKSNTFSMEWPPRSGQQQDFPEADRADWFGLKKAVKKLNSNQNEFIGRLAEVLDVNQQTTLF